MARDKHFDREIIELIMEENRFEEALQILRTIEATGDKSCWLYGNIGWCLGKLGNHKEAIKYLLQAEGTGEKDEDGWLTTEMGWNYSQLGNPKLAIYYLEIALEYLDVDHEEIHCEIGVNFVKLKQYREALLYFESANESGREDYWIYMRIGETLEKLKRYKKASEYFTLAKIHKKGDKDAINHLIFCLEKDGKKEEAKKLSEYLKSL